MSETVTKGCLESEGWTEEKVQQQKVIEERVPHTTCTVERIYNPDGWRLSVTRG